MTSNIEGVLHYNEKQKKVLTIGIITRNECEKLERCLKSLMPIKEAVDCEIIVTDTGSTDNTIEMAVKYADEIIKFDWIDDFSAARNTGIEASSGTWFMWIDSDEWIDDAKPLIDFLNGGEHNSYNTASFNFVDLIENSKNQSTSSTLIRAVKLYDGFFFEGKIHETFKLNEPTKDLNARIYHDGYMLEDNTSKTDKHLRNISILTSLYENNNKDINVIRYLIDQFRFNRDFEKANEYCDIGLDVLVKLNLKQEDEEAYRLHFIIQKAFNFMDIKQYKEAIILLENIKIKSPKNVYKFLDINFILAASNGYEGNRTEELEYSKKYIDAYIERPSLDKTYLYMFFEKSNKTDIFREMLLNTIEFLKEEDDAIKQYINAAILIKKEISEIDALNDYISVIFTGVLRYQKYGIFKFVYDAFIGNESVLRDVQFALNDFEDLLVNYIETYKDSVEPISKEISKLEINTKLVDFLKLVNINLSKENSLEKAIDFISRYECDKPYIKSEILYSLLKFSDDAESFITKNIDVYFTNEYTTFLVEPDDLFEIAINNFQNQHSNNIKYEYLILSILDSTIVRNKEKSERAYSAYKDILPNLMKSMYNLKNINEDNIDLYPPVIRFGYFMELAEEYRLKNELGMFVEFIKKAVQHYPVMESYIKILLEDVEGNIKAENERKKEFEQLAVNIKQKIYELITLGQSEEALSVICQLQSIMPNDKELKELKSRLTSF